MAAFTARPSARKIYSQLWDFEGWNWKGLKVIVHDFVIVIIISHNLQLRRHVLEVPLRSSQSATNVSSLFAWRFPLRSISLSASSIRSACQLLLLPLQSL